MLFKFKKLEIADVILIEPIVFADERDFFIETFKALDFKANNISSDFV